MQGEEKTKSIMNFFIVCFIVLIDQISKNYIYQNKVQYESPVPIIDGIINFTYLENTGIAFGLFSNMEASSIFFIILPIIITFYLISLLQDKEFQSNSSQISLLLIIGGAIGNIIDRIFRGYVVDFIQFDIDIFPYVFNIADSSVTIGLLFLLCSSIIVQR
ncbi:MAG: lipoprotein signal peptidase [Candidatus Neomarinimicrobiota bacterium]|mgnify:CR=1 FL=1|nr:MAG: lipoprotein signal peptidase [Candidatus Neomarinimicrobiota bacterium]